MCDCAGKHWITFIHHLFLPLLNFYWKVVAMLAVWFYGWPGRSTNNSFPFFFELPANCCYLLLTLSCGLHAKILQPCLVVQPRQVKLYRWPIPSAPAATDTWQFWLTDTSLTFTQAVGCNRSKSEQLYGRGFVQVSVMSFPQVSVAVLWHWRRKDYRLVNKVNFSLHSGWLDTFSIIGRCC